MVKQLVLIYMGLCSGMVGAKTAAVPKQAIQVFEAYADKAFCARQADAELQYIGHATYLATHADFCGHGGNGMPRQVITALQGKPSGSGALRYQIVAANILADLDIWGSVESIASDEQTIQVTMRQMAPDDARCCPSLLTRYTIEIGSWRLLRQEQLAP
ncbi:hypothetical protein AB8Q18_08105 [Neisseriaceae bacterium CLB008]|nr:hypothetical protein [Neisseriaceae bacterium]